MANKHGLKANIVKKQAAARRLSGTKKKVDQRVYTGNENSQARLNMSYKKRTRFMENKQKWPKKKLPSKKLETLVEMGIVDERGFFKKGKKKNFITGSMVDLKGFDYYGFQR